MVKDKRFLKRESHPNWKGGVTLSTSGYITVRNPYSDKPRYVRLHRLIMEKHLGRKLKDTELVHHKNGIRTDNRIENLQLLDRLFHLRIETGWKWVNGIWFRNCVNCKTFKPLSRFHTKIKNNFINYSIVCKDCSKRGFWHISQYKQDFERRKR